MKLKKIIIENYKIFETKQEIEFNNLNLIIGKNDIGKSTILEALNIFFNGNSKLSEDDVNKKSFASGKNEILIECIFDNIDKNQEIIIDSDAKTTFKKDFLLNKNGELQIKKIYSSPYKNATSVKTSLISNYPQEEKVIELISKKNSDLKKIAKELNINLQNANVNHLIREDIFNYYDIYKNDYNNLKETEIFLEGKEDDKKIKDQLEILLPKYNLFVADREINSSDEGAKDAMRLAIQDSIKNYERELEVLKNNIKLETQKIAENVIKITKETFSELLDDNETINTQIEEIKKIDSIFDIKLENDYGVNFNKRGSGIKRLLLIGFFIRKSQEKNKDNQIYAFEEPESFQNPENQKKLMEAFKKMSENNYQIICTTHNPQIASFFETQNIKLLEKNNEGKINIISFGDFSGLESITKKLYNTLGFLAEPLINFEDKFKIILYLEGKYDICVFKSIIKKLFKQQDLIEKILFIPCAGNSIDDWCKVNYLRINRNNKDLKEIVIIDGDKSIFKYDNIEIKQLKKREIENYLPIEKVITEIEDMEKIRSYINNNREHLLGNEHKEKEDIYSWIDMEKLYKENQDIFKKYINMDEYETINNKKIRDSLVAKEAICGYFFNKLENENIDNELKEIIEYLENHLI
ncbi:MAG: AAA family ATPase [Rickettsiales bacterium]|nr:AAA family ATPase [Rickettsiales bacterium]